MTWNTIFCLTTMAGGFWLICFIGEKMQASIDREQKRIWDESE